MSQSLSQIWVHIIFSTKNRYPFLKDTAIRQRLYAYIQAICHKKKCETIIVNGIEDHVHILTSLHKNISLSTLIETIKKSSSLWVKQLNTEDSTINQFYWQNGYGVFSVSQSNLLSVKSYIEKQKEHHQKYNFQEELKKFLTQHGVSYDEKYLWD